jgi:hypothetical protein
MEKLRKKAGLPLTTIPGFNLGSPASVLLLSLSDKICCGGSRIELYAILEGRDFALII